MKKLKKEKKITGNSRENKIYKLDRKTSILKHKQRNLKKPIIFFFVIGLCQKYQKCSTICFFLYTEFTWSKNPKN